MAVAVQRKKKTAPSRGKRNTEGIVFWTAFFVVMTGLFLANRETIRGTLRSTHLVERLTGAEQRPSAAAVPKEASPKAGPQVAPQAAPVSSIPEAAALEKEPVVPLSQEVADGVTEGDSAGSTAPQEQTGPEQEGDGGPDPISPGVALPPATTPSPSPVPATRDRAVYLIKVDRDGMLLRIKTIRKLPASGSPLLDTLHSLLAGPIAEEKRQGLISLIPPGTRILSAAVKGQTAYLNVSEDFLFNTGGVESYAAQLAQIVWTATEFSTVADVQILIEGRRIDYLGESIWMGSPLNRENL